MGALSASSSSVQRLILTTRAMRGSRGEGKTGKTCSCGSSLPMKVEYRVTGNVEVEWQGALKKGKKSGSWVQYWDNGQLMEKGNYKNGKEVGVWVEYLENGELKYKDVYKDGVRIND